MSRARPDSHTPIPNFNTPNMPPLMRDVQYDDANNVDNILPPATCECPRKPFKTRENPISSFVRLMEDMLPEHLMALIVHYCSGNHALPGTLELVYKYVPEVREAWSPRGLVPIPERKRSVIRVIHCVAARAADANHSDCGVCCVHN